MLKLRQFSLLSNVCWPSFVPVHTAGVLGMQTNMRNVLCGVDEVLLCKIESNGGGSYFPTLELNFLLAEVSTALLYVIFQPRKS